MAYDKDEQKLLNKFEELIDFESTFILDNFIDILNENDLQLHEVLYHLYTLGLIRVPDDFLST